MDPTRVGSGRDCAPGLVGLDVFAAGRLSRWESRAPSGYEVLGASVEVSVGPAKVKADGISSGQAIAAVFGVVSLGTLIYIAAR